MALPPSFKILCMVGNAARILVSSVTLNASLSGTLKSTLTSAFFPPKFVLLNVYMDVDLKRNPAVGLPGQLKSYIILKSVAQSI
jgi:hypothetical protein